MAGSESRRDPATIYETKRTAVGSSSGRKARKRRKSDRASDEKKKREDEDEGFWAPVGNEDFPDLEEDDAAAEPTRHRYTIRKK